MALVAYDNSDSSEFEDELDDTLPKKNETVLGIEVTSSKENITEKTDDTTVLFNLLPEPATKKLSVIEEDDEFLHKKRSLTNLIKPKAKIMVPSISDFKDVDSAPTLVKPKAVNGKKSGLLSMLPQPKNTVISKTTSLIPQVLAQKPSTVKKKESLPSPVKSKVIDYSDESDNDEVQNDYFSINKPIVLPVEDLPGVQKNFNSEINISPESSATMVKPNIESYFKQPEVLNQEENPNINTYSVNEINAESYATSECSSGHEVELNEEAIRKLCGARGKRKREEIQIIDVNQEEVLADAREQLLKGLMDDTTKRVSSSKKRGSGPTGMQKRKHQITYLAHQAKANEAELQNQWANNRQSKRLTQSKYGF